MYTSNSEFDLETRVQITNETPTLRTYQQMHHSLQNDTWKWLIGTEDVTYDLPVGGKYVTITDDDGNEVQSEVMAPPEKIVNGKTAAVYGPSVYEEWDADAENYNEVTPTYHKMEIKGTLAVEQDLFLHEIYRYLNCIYPDHPDWLNLLTRNEILDAFNNAAAMVDYKPNNEFFNLVANAIDSTDPDVEEFKLNLRNLTSNAARRKFYGSTLGYRMIGHDAYQDIMIFPIGKNLPVEPLDNDTYNGGNGTWNVKDFIIDTFDERYQTLFRRIDWLGENRDTSFVSANGYSYSTFIVPGYEQFAFEFVSALDGEYTASDYKLYKDNAYSFYNFSDGVNSDIIGSIAGTSVFDILEMQLYKDDTKLSIVSSDDKLYGTECSSNNNIQYLSLYKYKPISELEDFINTYSLTTIKYWNNIYNEDGSVKTSDTNYFNNYLSLLFKTCASYEALLDCASIYDKVEYLYNPFIKNTIVLPTEQMIALYDTQTDWEDTDVVAKGDLSLEGAALEVGDLISFRDFSDITNGTVYSVTGASYGYIDISFPGDLDVKEFQEVSSFAPFDVYKDSIKSKEYISIILKNSNNEYIELQGSMQATWGKKKQELLSANYLKEARFFIRVIPETKSANLCTLLYGTDAADTISEIKESLATNQAALEKAKALIKQTLNEELYGTPLETYEELSAKSSLTDDEKEQLENAISILEEHAYSYWEDYKTAEEAVKEDKADLEEAEEAYNDLAKNRDLLLDDSGNLTIGYDSVVDKIYIIGNDDIYVKAAWNLETGTVTTFTLGNISVLPIYPGMKYVVPDWHTFNTIDYSLAKVDATQIPRDDDLGQLYSEIADVDRKVAFTPTATTNIYNETTFTIEAQVYVDKEVGSTTNEMQFLSEDAKKKFDSICVGTKVSGPGISSETYVTSLSNNSLTISTTLPTKGYFTYKFECPVTTAPEEIDDPFNYKKVMNEYDNYDQVSFFDHGVYGTSEWPNVSSVVFDGDLKDKQIINPTTFKQVVKYLYSDKLETDTNGDYINTLFPSIGKYTRDVFVDIKANKLIILPNKVGNTENLMNVEWLDYIANNDELALAKENINVGANIILNCDTSGYASLLKDSSYTDSNLKVLFQSLNWSDSTIPAYVQLGTGGSSFKDFWQLLSNIYYPNVYGATFYDQTVEAETGAGNDDDNIADWREVGETDVIKRNTYAKVGKNSDKLSNYSTYENIDNPIFEIPLNEYNINLKTYQNSKTYTTIDALFYEQGFKNLTKEVDLSIAKSTDLSTSFLSDYQSVKSLNSSIADSVKYYYLATGDNDGEEKGDFYFTTYNNTSDAKAALSTEDASRWQKYDIYNGGTFGALLYYFNSIFYSAIGTMLFSNTIYKSLISTPNSNDEDKASFIDWKENPDDLLLELLMLQTYYYSDSANISNTLTLVNTLLSGHSIKSSIDTKWFENKLILFSYIKGNWDTKELDTNENGLVVDDDGNIYDYNTYKSYAESFDDFFGLKDFDLIGLLWDGTEVKLVKPNKNYSICTTDAITPLALLTQNQYNAFYGYSKYNLFSVYGMNAVNYHESKYQWTVKNNVATQNTDADAWYAASNDLSDYYMDLSNSFLNYTSSIYNIIQLPRKYITDGSYEINLFIDPQFIGEGYLYNNYLAGDTSTIKYNISQSAIKYDEDNDLFYTNAKTYEDGSFSDKNSKIVVKFEEQKYFKDLKFLYGAFKTELTQNEGSTNTTTEAYIRSITGESFDISDLSTSDKFVYAEEIDLRSLYTSSFNTRVFQGTKQLQAEIYGITKDGELYISGKRNKAMGRLYDSDLINTFDAIIPAEVSSSGVISKIDAYSTGLNFNDSTKNEDGFIAPEYVNVEIKKSITSGYGVNDDYTFKYYKNLLVFEGLINLKQSNTIVAPNDDSSTFSNVISILSKGDKVKGIVALSGGGYNTHTITTNIYNQAKYFAAEGNKAMVIDASGSVWTAENINYDSVNFAQFTKSENEISGTILNTVWSDDENAFLATVGLEQEKDEIFGYDYWKTTEVYAIDDDRYVSSGDNKGYPSVYNTSFTTNTELFTTNSDGVYVYNANTVTINDIIQGNTVVEQVTVNPDDIALKAYRVDEAPTDIADPSTEYGIAYNTSDKTITTMSEGPYVVRDPESDETLTYKLFSDGDVDIALTQEYMFAKTYNYTVDSDGNYTTTKTKNKHWKAVKIPVVLDYTLLHLKSMTVQGSNNAYDYVKNAFTTFISWAAAKDTSGNYSLIEKADELDEDDLNDNTKVKFAGQTLSDSYTYKQLKTFISLVESVSSSLMTYSDFIKKVTYWTDSTQHKTITLEGTSYTTDYTNYTNIASGITKVKVATGLPLVYNSTDNRYEIKSGANYTLEGTTDDYIAQSLAYKNYVNFEEMYYQYLYLALSKMIADLTSQNFGTKAITDMSSTGSKLFFRTITNDIISISKSNLYKASDMREATNWNVAKRAAGTYVKGSYEQKAADYNSVYFNDGSTTVEIPVSSRNFNVYLYRLTTDMYIAPDGSHLFLGGYTVPYDTVYSTLENQMSTDDAKEQVTEDWFTTAAESWYNSGEGMGSAPCILYSDDGGLSFNVLPLKNYVDDYLFSKDSYQVSSFDTYQDKIIAYVQNKTSGGNESKQIVISFDAWSGDVSTTDTEYKQLSLPSDGKIHTQELDEGYITWSDGRVGYGVDIDQSEMNGTRTFNIDYTGSNILTLPSNCTVKRVDSDSFALDKKISAGDMTSGKVRVLLAISTANDIPNPREYLTTDITKIYEYENKSTGYFKVDTVEEVSNYNTANRIYSQRYIDPQEDAKGNIIGYPTVDEDLESTASMYVYEYDDDGALGDVVPLTNLFGNEIKLSSEDGRDVLFEDTTMYSTEDLVRYEIDFDNAQSAGKNAVSITDASSKVSKMETLTDLTEAFTKNTINLTKFYTDDFYGLLNSNRDMATMDAMFEDILWPVSLDPSKSSNKDAIDEELFGSSTDASGYSDFIEFIVEKEGYFNYIDNPFSSWSERFTWEAAADIDGAHYVKVWDNKYNCYILNKRLFIAGTLVMPYTFYNGGNGISVVADPSIEYENGKLIGDGYLASGIYYHPMGYGGLRNNDSITENTPWDRDPAAFTNDLLINSLGNYVYLTDEYGNRIKTYNSVKIADGTESVSYDDFLNDGENKIIIEHKDGSTETKTFFKLFKLPETDIQQVHSSKYIKQNTKLILRAYNNVEPATSYDFQESKGAYVYNSNGEQWADAEVSGNILKVGTVIDGIAATSTMYVYLKTKFDSLGDEETNFTAEFSVNSNAIDIDDAIDDEETIVYQKYTDDNDEIIYQTINNTENGSIKQTYIYHTTETIDSSLLSSDLSGVVVKAYPAYTWGNAKVYLDDSDVYILNGSTFVKANVTVEKGETTDEKTPYTITTSYNITKDDKTTETVTYTATFDDTTEQENRASTLTAEEILKQISTINDGTNNVKVTETGTYIVIDLTIGAAEYSEVVIKYNDIEVIYVPVFITECTIYKNNDSYYLGDDELDTTSKYTQLKDYNNLKVETISDNITPIIYNGSSKISGLEEGDIITGLYGYCISRSPAYKTFSDLIYNLGVMIRKIDVSKVDGETTYTPLITGDSADNYYIEEDNLTDAKVSSVADDNSEIKLVTLPAAFEKYDDHKEHYFMFKILTIAHQNVAASRMNNENFFREVSITEMSTFPPDRVWYNSKGSPVPPIKVGEVILNSENNYAYYDNDYVNANHNKIRLCDEYGRYINYTVSGTSYRLDENEDGDCSTYVYSGSDGRYVSPEPVNATCQEWYKNNIWAKNKDVNPLWQIIHIVPKIENKVWKQNISLKQYTKSGNNQILTDPTYPYVTIRDLTNIEASNNVISYNENSNNLNLTSGELDIFLSEGSDYFKNNSEVTMYGLHFDTSKIVDMYTDNEYYINSTLQVSYTVNSHRDFTTSIQGDNDIVQVTELGIFNKEHKLIAYANFPPVEYRTSSQHLAFTCVIYHGNMVEY